MSQSRPPVVEVVEVDGRRLKLLRGEYWFVEAGVMSWYMYYVPTTTAPTMSLLIQLHGALGDPRNCCHWPSVVEVADKLGMIVAGVYGFNSMGCRWFGTRGQGMTENSMALSFDWVGDMSQADVMNVIGILRNEYPIDAKRIYVMGQSMGGTTAVHLASSYPEMFAGMCACCPNVLCQSQASQIKHVVKSLKDVPSFIIMGICDELIEVTEVRELVKEMEGMDCIYRYLELDATGHIDVLRHVSLWETSMRWLSVHIKATDAPEILRPSVVQHPEAYFRKNPEKDVADEMFSRFFTWSLWKYLLPWSAERAEKRAKTEPWRSPFEIKFEEREKRECNDMGKVWV